jgi:integrase/recombinase XerD
MTPLAPHLTAFLRDRLPYERGASPHTCDAYAYAFQLLLTFVAKRLQIQPSALTLEDLQVPIVLAFLQDLESVRSNSPRTRNARLAAIRSFARFLQYRAPACMEQIRGLLAIPMKRTDEALVAYLTHDEMQAVLDAPDPCTRDGVRDRAMLHIAFAAGLRVSELVGLRLEDIMLKPQPTIHVLGKGRRERTLPLWQTTTKALRAWLALRGNAACLELFLNAQGAPLT